MKKTVIVYEAKVTKPDAETIHIIVYDHGTFAEIRYPHKNKNS